MKRVTRLSIIVAAAILFAVPPLRAAERDAHVEMVFVKGGCFQMGSNDVDGDEKPAHEVCVADFSIGKYEVTQGQWQAVMGSNPSYFKSRGTDCPVENVSWNDVRKFIETLNSSTGKKYRLPKEAEWEYAARSSGKIEKYSGTNDIGRLVQCAWYCENSNGKTHKVGTRMPNGLGIYDMSGNVWEWVEDVYSNYGPRGKNSPVSVNTSLRVFRGGGWNGGPGTVRTANRCYYTLDRKSYDVGFRLAKTP